MKEFEGVFKVKVVDEGKYNGGGFDCGDQEGLKKFIAMNHGKEMILTLKNFSKSSEKQLMYSYYQKAVIGCTIIALTNDGWESVDDIIADSFLKQQVAQKLGYNKKGDVVIKYEEDKRSMSKERLHKYISDCIMFLENTFSIQVPDSQEYKTGFKRA